MRCDCHVHIVGPADRHPQVPSRTYLADLAPLEELRRRGAERAVTRFVIVQASFYGTDNSLLLESLDALGGDGRGVAVIDPTTSPATLMDYTRRGVRGLRLNLYSTAGRENARPLDEAFARLSDVAQAFAWHVEVIASLDTLSRHAEVLARAAVPVVIDHYGLYGDALPESADARRLLELIRLSHVWIKLSAPYRVSPDPLATRPDQRWLDAILTNAADRCVWGATGHTRHCPRNMRGPPSSHRIACCLTGGLSVTSSPRLAPMRSPTASCRTIRRGSMGSKFSLPCGAANGYDA